MHPGSAIGKGWTVRIAVIADAEGRDQAEKLVVALASEGVAAELIESAAEAEEAVMATALLTFEAKLTAERPDALALLGDGSEALAGAIAAAKLEVTAFRVGGGETGHGRIVDILSERTVAASPAEAAREIAAALLH